MKPRLFLLALCCLSGCLRPAWAEVNDVAIALQEAQEHHLSAWQTKLLLCVRVAENGRPGREYGVLHPQALNRSQDVQAGWTAASIAKRCATPSALPAFARRWAPVHSETDNGTNQFWLRNVQTCLARLD